MVVEEVCSCLRLRTRSVHSFVHPQLGESDDHDQGRRQQDHRHLVIVYLFGVCLGLLLVGCGL